LIKQVPVSGRIVRTETTGDDFLELFLELAHDADRYCRGEVLRVAVYTGTFQD